MIWDTYLWPALPGNSSCNPNHLPYTTTPLGMASDHSQGNRMCSVVSSSMLGNFLLFYTTMSFLSATYEVSVVSLLTGQSETITVNFRRSPRTEPPEQERVAAAADILPQTNWSGIVTAVKPYVTWKSLAAVLILVTILLISCCLLFVGSGSATSPQHPIFQPSTPATPQPAFPSSTQKTALSTFSHSGNSSPFRPVGQTAQGETVRSPLTSRLFSE